MLGNGLTFPFSLLSTTHGGKWLAGPGCFTLRKACLLCTVWEAEELKAGGDIRTKDGALVLTGNRTKLLGRPARSPVIIPTARSLVIVLTARGLVTITTAPKLVTIQRGRGLVTVATARRLGNKPTACSLITVPIALV